MNKINKIISAIKPVDKSLTPTIVEHLNQLTKPTGSLGRLEELVLQYCLIQNTIKPLLTRKQIVVFAADHGVAEEGISAYPSEVTLQMVKNFLSGGAAINVLANHVDADIKIVDIGVRHTWKDNPQLNYRKIKSGTNNFTKGPAMTYNDALQAIEVGVEMAEEAYHDKISILGTGDMGIGNTTASSALYSVLLPCEVNEVTGLGTGLDQNGLKIKIKIIKNAIQINKERLTDPISILAALGGFEIAGICGLILGAAVRRIPVVVDGFISSAAALVAIRLNEYVKEYLYWGHTSAENGHSLLFNHLGVQPILDMNMRLGEGTGAALAMSLIEAAVKIYNEMATFGSAGVSSKVEYSP
jgi:nicotinate-nucleotide--dimethylbenzimidazole phosphoribosyltransferase